MINLVFVEFPHSLVFILILVYLGRLFVGVVISWTDKTHENNENWAPTKINDFTVLYTMSRNNSIRSCLKSVKLVIILNHACCRFCDNYLLFMYFSIYFNAKTFIHWQKSSKNLLFLIKRLLGIQLISKVSFDFIWLSLIHNSIA